MPNRLAKEQSPYLRQHANNPVDWYPWGMEAFAKAKREDKPIFLSIGYSSCHWCHVMAKESFSDQTIASLLNDHFVAIKVDREERPDIDKHFQEVYRLLNRRPGGWPTSIFLTPEKKAFYAATYIPPEPRYGMVGFKELLETIAKRYAQNKEKIIQEAQQIDEALTKRAKSIQATKLELSILHRYASQAKAHFDEMFGGFGKAPKFPQTSLHETLLDCYRLTGEKELLNMSLFTLSEMARGGFRDVVEGGFCRYSTDDEWLLPHFEKMLYDNALLAKLYLRAFHLSGNDFYKTVAFETLDFLISRMSREDLFFSAIDAQSKGVEGGYYIYDYQEALQAFKEAQIPPTATKELLVQLHITPEGNFGGKNIVRLEDITQTPKHPYYSQAIEALRTLRAKRPHPFIDQKIITSWNAMVIEALFMAGRIETRYLEQAEQSLKALSQMMFAHKRLYHSALIGHTPEIHAFLEDYAYLAQAYLEGYQSTLDELYLIQAQQLLNQAIERFYQKGRWLFSRGDFETEASKYDRSYPSSLALIIQTAQSIASLVDGVYEKFVFKSLEIHSYDLMRQPLQTPKLTQATLRYLLDDLTIKALPSALQPHIRQKDKLPYPYVLYRTDTQKGFMLCNKTACFAHEKHFEETVQAINRITKGRIK